MAEEVVVSEHRSRAICLASSKPLERTEAKPSESSNAENRFQDPSDTHHMHKETPSRP